MTYDDKVKIMLDYMKLKIHEKDWHGVADCAMDLRDIESERNAILEVYRGHSPTEDAYKAIDIINGVINENQSK